MDTSTLLLVVGGVVVAKTTALAVLVARRDRRQRRTLDTVVVAARRVEPSGWGLQWAEPGVLLVTNASSGAVAREVELSAELTASSGVTDFAEHLARFVGTGASVELRFAGLERWLTDVAGSSWETAAQASREMHDRLACTLTYSIRWRSPEGERRHESRTAQPVLPVPDHALRPA